MKKINFIVLSIIALIVLVLLLPSILNLFTKDIDPIADSDLSLQVISVLDKDNAYFDLIKIEDIIYQPEGKRKEIMDIIDNKVWNQELAEDIISNNQKTFELFSQAARKSKFQNPQFADPKNINPTTIPTSLTSWRIMSEYSFIKATSLLKQGKEKEAIEEALNSVYIAQKIQESQASLIEYLVAIAMKERGLEAVQTIFSSADFNSSELKKYVSEMNQFYQNEDGLIVTIKAEYYIQSLIIDAFVIGDTDALQSYTREQSQDLAKKLKNNYYFRPNKTKALFASYVRNRIEDANQFCNNVENIEIQRQAPASYIEMYLSENLIGKILYDTTAVSLTSVNTKKCNEDILVSATQTLIAIKAYQNDNGNYPDSLEQLVPSYLASVPLDYFDGNSIRYSKEDKILYSIGEDSVDAGGSTGEDWKKMPDPTFKINF